MVMTWSVLISRSAAFQAATVPIHHKANIFLCIECIISSATERIDFVSSPPTITRHFAFRCGKDLLGGSNNKVSWANGCFLLFWRTPTCHLQT